MEHTLYILDRSIYIVHLEIEESRAIRLLIKYSVLADYLRSQLYHSPYINASTTDTTLLNF